MMHYIKQTYHFLGGIYFAILLIALAAMTVIAGTFLESWTGSHLYASKWTYSHPLFAVLLSLFFINILFSALRRWPFKVKHIPFLITHLGLLMIISGTIIKNGWGLQGNLSLWEGSGSQHLLLPNTYSLHVENRLGEKGDYELATLEPRQTYQKPPFPELKLKIIGSTPHVSEKWETWIKGHFATISGIPPFPVSSWSPKDPLPSPALISINAENQWNVIAVRSDHLEELIKDLYLQDLETKGFSKDRIKLSLPFRDQFMDPYLEYGTMRIPLNGQKALFGEEIGRPWMPIHKDFDLFRPFPLLLLAETSKGETSLFLFDQYGRVHGESFGQARLKNLLSYDQGFGGYAVQTTLPDPSKSKSRTTINELAEEQLKEQLCQAMKTHPPLAPPLQLLKDASEKVETDFIDQLVAFLMLWEKSGNLLLTQSALNDPLALTLQNIDWNAIRHEDKKALQWITLLFERIEEPLKSGEKLLELLEKHRWPFVDALKNQDVNPLTLLSQQIFSIVHDLPPLVEETTFDKSKLFSAYLKAFEIEFSSLRSYPHETSVNLILETPLTVRHQKEIPPTKIEDHQPGLLIEAQTRSHKQLFTVAYDGSGFGFQWPFLQGEYLIRFQPQKVEIPYRMRLKQARQINYPQTQQPYSYEADLWITENGKEPLEKTISMNQVHETWDGHRFYLAGMSPQSDQTIRRAQIIVNHDPAKYLLTYPGALLIALGILLLFWLQPYKRR